jgi:hypothetical protein
VACRYLPGRCSLLFFLLLTKNDSTEYWLYYPCLGRITILEQVSSEQVGVNFHWEYGRGG